MSKRGRTHDLKDLTWPPPRDDVEVLDLHAPPAGKSQAPPPAPREQRRDLKAEQDQAGVPDRSQPPTPGARARRGRAWRNLGWLTIEHAALLVLTALVILEGAVILWGRYGTPPPPGPAPTGTAGVSENAPPPASPDPASPAATTAGYLAVRTQPPGAAVSLDGERLGVAPVTVPQLEPGEHEVVIQARGQTVRHQFRAGAGEIISLVVPLTAAGAAPASPSSSEGSLTVRSPVELRILQGDRLLGTSQMTRVPIAAGTHSLQLTNESVGYQQTRTVTVERGKTTTIDVEMPTAPVAVNALPWAEVWVDGARVGETPLGRLPLSLGPHVVVLRHPQLGEKTVRTVVKANEPGRISVDMRK